jgi:hypothetical protein
VDEVRPIVAEDVLTEEGIRDRGMRENLFWLKGDNLQWTVLGWMNELN